MGLPWWSHPCTEGYPQCHRVRAVGMERSDRQHQPIADMQSRFTVYVTGLLPEPPKRIFQVWGRHGGPIRVLRATHSATGCVPWVWRTIRPATPTVCRYAVSIHRICPTKNHCVLGPTRGCFMAPSDRPRDHKSVTGPDIKHLIRRLGPPGASDVSTTSCRRAQNRLHT